MNNDIPNVPTEEVVDMSPFKRLVMTIGTLPNAFTESLTYYEALAYFVQYLEKTVIPAINQNGEATKELQQLFVELKDYVDHYFDDLNVQEEINNKLDAMVEDGTMAEIINQEVLDNVKTVTDAILAQNAPFTYHYIYSSSNGFGNSLFVEGDKNIIVDFGNNSGVVDAYLRSKNVTKIDAIVITHYHADHTGGANAQGLAELLNDTNIDFTECIAYLPHKGIDWSQVTASDKSTIMQTETAVKAMLTSAGITYVEPDNTDKVDLSSLTSIEFFNIGSSFYDNYYAYDVVGMPGNTDYNSFSMLVKITHNGVSEFETGDATFLTQKYNAQYLTDIKIYHSFHHGVYTPLHKNWELRLYADYCVTTPNEANLPAENSDIICCGMRGARIHNVKDYGNTLKIVQTGTTLKCDADYNAKKNNLGVATRPLVELEPGTDLNDVTDDGCYYAPHGGISETMSNLPPCDETTTGHAFRLDVIKISSHLANNDDDVKQILTFANAREELSGFWVRENRRYNQGFGQWYYLGAPSYTAGTVNIGSYGYGVVSGDGKEISLSVPLTRYIPIGYTFSNPVIQSMNIKAHSGSIAYAASSSQSSFSALVDRIASGIRVRLYKTDESAFSVSDVCVAGNISISFTLTKVS